MEENKSVSMTKKGAILYTVASFLLVTLLIFMAVMITYNSTVKTLGEIYSKQIALQNASLSENEVTNLKSVQTVKNGKTAFKVSFSYEGEERIIYVDSETGKIIESLNEQPEAPEVPETPEQPEEPTVPENPEQPETPEVPDTEETPDGGNEAAPDTIPDTLPDAGTDTLMPKLFKNPMR